jgi:hypothetical protein
MSKETRTLIDLGDITGIELECHQCKTRVLYPLGETGGEKLAPECPNPSCKVPLFIGGAFPGADADIKSLVRALKSFSKGRTDLAANLRFRVATLS